MRPAAPLPFMIVPGLLVVSALITAGCADAQSTSSNGPPLPACEWCGTAEAPADPDWEAALAPESEPGERLEVRGVVYQPDGVTPAAGVILYLYHTNARGAYPRGGNETGNGRRHGYLRGWVRTDDRGRYGIRTIQPGSYPEGGEAAHIHITVQEPDGSPEYWVDSFLFAGDPYLEEDEGGHVLAPEEGSDGVWRARQDIVLPARDTLSAAFTASSEQVLCVDTRRSVVRWRGTKVTGGSQEGTVRLSDGRLHLRDGRIAGGDFLVDMTTIAVTSIPDRDATARAMLERHLAHEEWFGVERFPTARLVLTSLTPYDGNGLPAGAGSGRDDRHVYRVSGILAVRDSVHPVRFEAVATAPTGQEVRAKADLVIDRQRWGVRFDGATSALRNLLVRDPIELGLELVARADACEVASTASGDPAST